MPAGSRRSRPPLRFPGRCAGPRCTPPPFLPRRRSREKMPARSRRSRPALRFQGTCAGPRCTGKSRGWQQRNAPGSRNIARRPVHRDPANLPAWHTRVTAAHFPFPFGVGSLPWWGGRRPAFAAAIPLPQPFAPPTLLRYLLPRGSGHSSLPMPLRCGGSRRA
jgi:hypothetical protein